MSDWPDELEGDVTAAVSAIHNRLTAVHASMDDWATDFLAALAAREEALRLFVEIDTANGNTVDKP